MQARHIIVFLGPSLNIDTAKSLLPEAIFMPPVRCGDVLRVARLNPDIIVLIDGYFENTPAVWHKEILYALSQGIVVFGASSMGALRASELKDFGMRAFGDIANYYSNGTINDDDEVALLHTENNNFHHNSMAMINIRRILDDALAYKVIDNAIYQLLISTLKSLHYRQRHLLSAIDMLSRDEAYHARLSKLKTWLEKNEPVDLKKQDAINVLSYIAKNDVTPNEIHFNFNTSNLFRSLHKSTACRPFSDDYPWLPKVERVALAARYLDETYLLIRRLAYLLSACYQLAIDKPHVKADYKLENILKLLNLDANATWLNQDAATSFECDSQVYQGFMSRMTTTLNLLAHARYQNELIDAPNSYLLLTMKIYGAYPAIREKMGEPNADAIIQHFRTHDPKQYQLFNMIAITWWYINTQANHLGLTPNITALQQFSDQFRKRHQLLSVESLQAWLNANDLNPEGYEQMVIAMVNVNYLAMQNQLDILLSKLHTDYHWWFADALYLSGYYHDAKQILEDDAIAKQYKDALADKVKDDDDWLARDFL